MIVPCNSKKIADNLIDWIRDYSSSHIDSQSIDEQDAFPPHVFLDMGNKGFFGIHISEQYGGLGLKTQDILRIIEQLAAIDLTLAMILIESIQGAHTLENYATQSIKDQYLPLVSQGRLITAGALTESEAGSNPRAMKSVAIEDDNNGWTIRGSKRWIGMASSASIIAMYVHQVDANNNWQGISGFLVPQGQKGLHIGAETQTMGLRGFSKNTVYMNDIKVSAEYLLGKPGEGMEIAQDNMMYIRLCIAAACVGAMKRCIQLMFRYAERRIIATGHLLENPITLIRLSEMASVVDALNNFVTIASQLYDKDPTKVPEEAYVISKIVGSEYLAKNVDFLVQMLGARGYEEANGASKIYRDARALRILEGPTEALNMYLGSRVLEKNAVLESFICDTLQQETLYHEMKNVINKVNQHCLAQKQDLFDKPFSVNYWIQALVGDIISYGLMLCALNYSLVQKPSEHLERSAIWARSKYEEAIQKALTFSMEEKLLIQPDKLREIVSNYTDTIGNIDQLRQAQNKTIDSLLTFNQELDNHQNNRFLTQDFSKTSSNESYQKQNQIVTETERHELLHRWQRIKKFEKPSNKGVHHLFATQAAKTPQDIAVAFDDQHISYEALHLKSNQIARHLQNEGITANKIVAIYCERSIDMIVGLLGIIKSGAAYLPLDYHYPESTLKFMFKDSGAELVLSQKKLADDLPFDDAKVIFIEDVLASSDIPQDVSADFNEDNLGYVIYTSGSTGQPKGVMLPHRALTNLINWHIDKINARRNVLQFTTLNFDMSFIEVFSALCSGGTLALISEHDRMDLPSFAKVIKKHTVEQAVLSVPFLKNLAELALDKSYFSSLKEIIVAGEQLVITPAILDFFNSLKSCRLLNYYGPSETHVVTGYDFPEQTSEWPDYAPIGHEIYNTKILILDDEKRLVPIGATGEIYIGGVSLAKGYLNRAELTGEKFIADPWGDHPTDRLYRTGDYGKYLPDGNLVFLGRKDEQVKIRGFRIEPQEIEWHLMKYAGIKEAVVIAKKSIFSDKHLEAFIVVEGAANDNAINDIYLYLQDKLPPHMLPSRFNILDKLPLTNSGKINRSALEEYESTITYALNTIVEPATQTEQEVIALLENMFKVKIGTNNSFISIGGSSLLAMQVVSLLQNTFSVEMPAHSILSDPTIAHTAKRIDILKNTVVHTHKVETPALA